MAMAASICCSIFFSMSVWLYTLTPATPASSGSWMWLAGAGASIGASVAAAWCRSYKVRLLPSAALFSCASGDFSAAEKGAAAAAAADDAAASSFLGSPSIAVSGCSRPTFAQDTPAARKKPARSLARGAPAKNPPICSRWEKNLPSMAKLDVDTAFARFDKLHQALKDGALEGCSSLALVVDKSDDNEYSKSVTIQTWTFGYELPETVVALTPSVLFVLTSDKKCQFLKDLAKERDGAGYTVKLLARQKDLAQNKAHFEEISAALKSAGKVAVFAKEKGKGAFADAWNESLKAAGVEMVDATKIIGFVYAVKTDAEIAIIRTAAELSTALLQRVLKKRILDAVDGEKKITHEQLAAQMESFVDEGKKALVKLKLKEEVDDSQVTLCYPPVIQSGGVYKLKISSQSDTNHLKDDAIVCMLGARYRLYCSNIARTLLIEPTKNQEKDYKYLAELYQVLIKAMKPGATCGGVYSDVVAHVTEHRSDLLPFLIKNFGYGQGIEFKDGAFNIAENNTAELKKGMTFSVQLGFEGMPPPEGEKKYAVFLSDTVLITDGEPEVLTTAKYDYDSIFFTFKDEEEEEGEAATSALLKAANITDDRQQRQKTESAEAKRKRHQKELAEQAEREAKERLQRGQAGSDNKKRSENFAYKKPGDMPGDETRKLKIFIDKKHEAVVVPIFGMATPFHISTIKNISYNDDDKDQVYLRINFSVPTQTAIRNKETGKEATIYLKEITYTSQSFEGLSNAHRLIKDLQKRYREREKEKAELEDLVEQADLILNKRGPIQLNDLFVRPQMEGTRLKRQQGTLQAHVNGFRYFSPRRNEVIDILYSNIKHAFYQSCKNEIMIILHFHLKNPILVGKKKHKDVQVYMEVGEVSFDLDKGRAQYDRDELEAEQRERKNRQKWTKLFESFTRKVEEYTSSSDYPVEFNTLCYEIGFNGVPLKQAVFLQPTTSSCLVNLTEWPSFVLSLSEVERVHFERVDFSLKNFDIVFVNKDYKKPVTQVLSVPMKSLDHIKEWLDSCDIVYTEGPASLDWKKIMKTINEDPAEFFEAVGWERMLGTESGGESDAGEDDEPSSEEFVPSDMESSESSEDYTSDDSDDSDSDDSDSDDNEGEEEEEEEGKSWEELESEAADADRRKQQEWDEEEQDVRRKAQHKAQQKRNGPSNGKAKAKPSHPKGRK
eukprot:m.190442 g.190442  ORF g.190442 m.190442 type:complete len:1178 (+) comp21702_c1_seq2:829-4362(+)